MRRKKYLAKRRSDSSSHGSTVCSGLRCGVRRSSRCLHFERLTLKLKIWDIYVVSRIHFSFGLMQSDLSSPNLPGPDHGDSTQI